MRRSPRPLALAFALVGVHVGSAAPAHAEPPSRTSSLGWDRLAGAEGCIGTRDLALAVEARLGRAVFVSAAQAEVSIDGRIAPAPAGAPGFRAHLTLSDAHGVVLGTRDLDGAQASPDGGSRPQAPGCRALDEQLALVIALLIDPEAALAPRKPPPAGPVLPPQVVVERVFVPVPTLTPRPKEPWRESFDAGATVAAGLLPRAGFAATVRAELTPPGFIPIELGASVWLDGRAVVPTGPARGVTLSLAYAMVGLCPLGWAKGGTRVRGCAEIEVGAIKAVGFGFTTADDGGGSEDPVVMGSLSGRVSRRLVGPLELSVGLSLVVPFDRARFYYLDAAKNQQELFRMAPVAGLADAAVGVAFP